MLDIEEWIPVYQGTGQTRVWKSYDIPIGNDWVAWFDSLSAINEVQFINDNDDTSRASGSIHFSMILDISPDLPISPTVHIDYSLGDIRLENNQEMVSASFTSTVMDSDSYNFTFHWEFGAVIIDCINREYCKKLIIQLPRQKHPYHYHKQKEETFQLLHGDLEVELEGHKTKLIPGDIFLVKPNQWHKFHTLDGSIFEEVSTTHYNNDSFYEDAAIEALPREERKTKVANWKVTIKNKL